ncbi:MAG TPA: NB-ARC domain-containing protein [Anaerolineales bacterium]|nr:NB-ARC domain-containing protein [Anaerolineales bacterium]HLO30497.1 NB-ARC domain-containing protein [Anaerolineales bacterium]
MDKEEVTHLERMIDLHKKNLYILEEMLAKYGADQPLHLINSVTMEREAIARYSKQIESLTSNSKALERSTALANLPRRPYFVGRDEEIKTILESLQPNSRTFIIGIEGIGGVGKSTLAMEVSHRCIENGLFQAVIWISAQESILTLHGIEPVIPEAKSLSDILIAIGAALGNPTIGNLSIQDQIRRAYNLLARQTTLLILDNFETLSKNEQRDILDFLRRSPITLKVVITSRERVSEGQVIRLAGLSFEESHALLEWDAQQKNIHLTKDQSKYLVDLTGGLPLALLWVQGQIAVLGYSVTQVLDKLSLDADIPILQYCFNHSWNLLGQSDAKKLLFILALQPDPVSRATLQEIAGILTNEHFGNEISHLLQLSLIDHEHDKDYFSILPLTRRFVRTQFTGDRKFIKQAEVRIAQHCVKLLSQKSNFQEWRSYDDLLLDRNNILSVAQWCYKSLQVKQTRSGSMAKQTRNIAEILVQIGTQFGSVLWQRAYWYDRMTLAHAALHAAKLISDWKSVSTFARNISWIYFYQGDYLRALHWAEEALAATTKTEDQLLIAAAQRSLGTVEMRLGNFVRSEKLLLEVLKTSSEFASDDYGIYSKGFAQYGLGELEYERGNVKTAKEWYQKALDTWQDPVRKDPVRHISYALNGLGFVALKEKRYEDAKRFFTAGIQSGDEFGRVDELAKAQFGLASVYFETDTDLKPALALVNESIESFQQQGMQYEIQKAKVLQEDILKASPQILIPQ